MPNWEVFNPRQQQNKGSKKTLGSLSVYKGQVCILFGALSSEKVSAGDRVAVLFSKGECLLGIRFDPNGRKISKCGKQKVLRLHLDFARQFSLSGRYAFDEMFEDGDILAFRLVQQESGYSEIVVDRVVDSPSPTFHPSR